MVKRKTRAKFARSSFCFSQVAVQKERVSRLRWRYCVTCKGKIFIPLIVFVDCRTKAIEKWFESADIRCLIWYNSSSLFSLFLTLREFRYIFFFWKKYWPRGKQLVRETKAFRKLLSKIICSRMCWQPGREAWWNCTCKTRATQVTSL